MKESVIVTAAGSIVGEGIIKCLKLANSSNDSHVSYNIVAADMSAQAPGLYRGNHGALLPSPESQNYLQAVIDLCKKHEASAIYVGSEEEMPSLAEHNKRIYEESGTQVITNPSSVINLATDKWKTYQFLKDQGLPCAESCMLEDRQDFVKMVGFPIVVKPRKGHGSINFFIAHDAEELDAAISAIERDRGEPILQEYLKADNLEFTTGITISKHGESVMSSITMRRILKHGQTYKAFVDDFATIRKLLESAAVAVGGRGPINIQSRTVDSSQKIFEINPRFSASCPIRAVAGVNEPDIVFRNQILDEEIQIQSYQRIVGLRYWNELYLPSEVYENASHFGNVVVEGAFIQDYF